EEHPAGDDLPRPRPRRRAHRAPGPAARAGRRGRHVRRRRARPPRRRAARAGRHARGDRPRPGGRGALRRLRGRGPVPHPLHPRLLLRRPRRAGGRGAAGGPRLPGPRHVVHADRHAGARLLLRLRRAAGHAHGHVAVPHGRGDRQHVGRAATRPGPARLWRGALRPPDRTGHRAHAGGRGARDDPRARRRHPARHPHARPLRRGSSRQADVPGDPHRGERRARPDRRGAARRLEPAAPGRPLRRDVVPLPRGPAREALPRRPRARLRVPAGPARLRLRPRAARRAHHPPVRRPHPGRGRRQPPLRVGAPARRPQAPGGPRGM
ncbi:MAG: 16S rRNA (cytosine(1402)-N(4))-methyltransferase, partial [uncultured Solirubrobacteraceae bacterium]